jgi:hypothetical protein
VGSRKYATVTSKEKVWRRFGESKRGERRPFTALHHIGDHPETTGDGFYKMECLTGRQVTIDLYASQTNALVQYTTLTADPSIFAREAPLLEG